MGQLSALSAKGNLLWTLPTMEGSAIGVSLGSDGTIFVEGSDPCLYAIK